MMPTDWPGWIRLASRHSTPTSDLAKSDGESLLFGPGRVPAFWDDAEAIPPFAYLRQIDDELIYVQPPTGAGPLGHEACVYHVFLVPGQTEPANR